MLAAKHALPVPIYRLAQGRPLTLLHVVQVTQMCRAMVINYGFSDVGPWSLMDQGSQSPDMIMRMMSRNSISETLQHKIDIAVRKIADEAYEAALQHIRYHSSLCTLACCMQCTGFACSLRAENPCADGCWPLQEQPRGHGQDRG